LFWFVEIIVYNPSMKVFFVASPRSANKEPGLFIKINSLLGKEATLLGDMVPTWTKGNVSNFYNGTHKERVDHFKKTVEYVKKADAVFVELSEHSMSMGYIVNKALENSKPVVALYKKGFEPYFFSGIEDSRLLIVEYTEENIEETIREALNKIKDYSDVRFNFFVSPKILNYLDWIAQKRMIPRSVFLRNLIEREIKKDKEFKE